MNAPFDYTEFQINLTRLIDEDFRAFAVKGINTNYPFLGVRTPHLRELAKDITTRGHIDDFLRLSPKSYEEATIMGFIIATMSYDEMKKHLNDYFPLIDNWATCDTFVSTLKSIKNHREDFLDTVIDPLLKCPNEFTVRFALVVLKSYYIVPDYLPVIFDRIAVVQDRGEYYIRMGLAWLLAECFTKYPDETFPIFATKRLPKFVQNKAISKICDSYRVPSEAKELLKTYRILQHTCGKV